MGCVRPSSQVPLYSTQRKILLLRVSNKQRIFLIHFDIDICIYSTCIFVVVVDCQPDFDVDNVQRCEHVNFYGV